MTALEGGMAGSGKIGPEGYEKYPGVNDKFRGQGC